MLRALIVFGGWEKHDPAGVARLFEKQLQEHGIEVESTNSFECLKEYDLSQFNLIVPVWTLDTIDPGYIEPILEAVRNGVGLAGNHGIIDSFRHEAEFHLMLGGQWVSHFDFAVTTHEIHMDGIPSPITAGLPTISVTTEQYYVLVDPANEVLATMRVPDNVAMPVAWTKRYGKGRVFYCSLGHSVDILEHPDILTLVTRGMLWAAGYGEIG